MEYFAEISNGIVGQVIVVDTGGTFPDSEPIGQAFITTLGLNGEWLQTSYNGNFRGKYAGQGDTYDPVLDEFVAPTTEEE